LLTKSAFYIFVLPKLIMLVIIVFLSSWSLT